uniref:Uncharacterized protein n=1 Tax=Cacopsylla melanoneura TaxID=428564 RepID=A0A8D8M5F9_9HEMI
MTMHSTLSSEIFFFFFFLHSLSLSFIPPAFHLFLLFHSPSFSALSLSPSIPQPPSSPITSLSSFNVLLRDRLILLELLFLHLFLLRFQHIFLLLLQLLLLSPSISFIVSLF